VLTAGKDRTKHQHHEDAMAGLTANEYMDDCGVRYVPPGRQSSVYLPMLTQLNGLPWDELTLAYVSTLRPSYIRVVQSNGGVTADSRAWRVTVTLKDQRIVAIEQETPIQLPTGIAHGHAMARALMQCSDNGWLPIATAPWETEVMIGAWSDGEFRYCRSTQTHDAGNEMAGEPAYDFWTTDDDTLGVSEDPDVWRPMLPWPRQRPVPDIPECHR
jgi:hypothetical protein